MFSLLIRRFSQSLAPRSTDRKEAREKPFSCHDSVVLFEIQIEFVPFDRQNSRRSFMNDDFVPKRGINEGYEVDVDKTQQLDGTGMRSAIFDWSHAVFLALGTGILVSVLFGGAVLILSWGSGG
ncbi:MAG: hypothetical protein ACKVQU_05030 [Burkholderiales bacterium]